MTSLAAPLGGVRSHVRLTCHRRHRGADPTSLKFQSITARPDLSTEILRQHEAGLIGEIICTRSFDNRIMNIMISNAYNEEIM